MVNTLGNGIIGLKEEIKITNCILKTIIMMIINSRIPFMKKQKVLNL